MLGEKCFGGTGDSCSALFPALRRTVYIKQKSNNNLIGVGGLGYRILRDFGLLLHLGVLGSFGGLPELAPWQILVLV